MILSLYDLQIKQNDFNSLYFKSYYKISYYLYFEYLNYYHGDLYYELKNLYYYLSIKYSIKCLCNFSQLYYSTAHSLPNLIITWLEII